MKFASLGVDTRTCDVEGLSLAAAHHIHRLVVETIESAHPAALRVRYEAVGFALELVVRCPSVVGEECIDVAHVGVVDVERNPVPTACEVEVLHTQVAGCEHSGDAWRTYHAVVDKMDRRFGFCYVGRACACVPNAEFEVLALFGLVRIYGEHCVVSIIDLIILIVAYSHTFAAVECSQDVLFVSRIEVVDKYLAEYRHVVFIIGRIYAPRWLFAFHLNGDRQCFYHVVVVAEVNHFVVGAYVEARVDVKLDVGARNRVDGSARRRYIEPRWHILYGVVLNRTAIVVGTNGK